MNHRSCWKGGVADVLMLSFLGVLACQPEKAVPFESSDADADGYSAQDDCDDADPNVYPSQQESCEDGIDNDCNELVDLDDTACQSPGGTSTVYDADGDGWSLPDDCDDSNADVYPGAAEICDEDQRDDDCGGTAESDEEGVAAVGCVDYMPDLDGDGMGDADQGQCLCGEPDLSTTGHSWTTESGDCDDDEPRTYAEAPTGCATQDIDDADCDGNPDSAPADCTLWYRDADGDGRGDPEDVVCGCEQPTGYVADASGCASSEMQTYYRDADGDGYGSEDVADDDSPASRDLCEPTGVYSVLVPGDCDDDNPDIYPGAPDDCGGVDYDCDQVLDLDLDGDGAFETASLEDEYGRTDAYDCVEFYKDYDGDGYGDEWTSECFCPDMDEGAGVIWPSADEATYDDYTSLVATDCDDDDAETYPGATETCDEEDNDCDDFIDEFAGTTFYDDEDGDGHGDPSSARRMCDWYAAAYGYVSGGDDCDDDSSTSYPRDSASWDEATSGGICDGHDDDCDGEVDEGLKAWYYEDGDGDGHGDEDDVAVELCVDDHDGFVDSNDDCNDGNVYIHPGRTETCNGVDDDCDGIEDGKEEDDDLKTKYWPDEDGDYLGDRDADPDLYPALYCAGGVVGMAPNSKDCDDDDATIRGVVSYYLDRDNDGYGGVSSEKYPLCPGDVADEEEALDCTGDCGLVSNNSDCDDTDKQVYPGKSERCNEKDDDCDGVADEELGGEYWYLDADGDGFGAASSYDYSCTGDPSGRGVTYVEDDSDCNDDVVGGEVINPDAVEVCDGVDNDCDSETDTVGGSSEDLANCCDTYTDGDFDEYGDEDEAATPIGCYCSVSSGQSFVALDCNDGNDNINPTGMHGTCGFTAAPVLSDYYHPTEAESPGSACWLIP